MSYTRTNWAKQVLSNLGNTNPSQQVIEWIVAWTQIETSGTTGAQYNLLNTEQVMPGSTFFNHTSETAGVQNFVSFVQGCEANSIALQNGYYTQIEAALRGNDIAALMHGTNINHELSTWGTGSVQSTINATMGQGLNDAFAGTLPGNVSTEWNEYIKDLPTGTGIYNAWVKQPSIYGVPLTREETIGTTVRQEFEHATAFWINGNAHFRTY